MHCGSKRTSPFAKLNKKYKPFRNRNGFSLLTKSAGWQSIDKRRDIFRSFRRRRTKVRQRKRTEKGNKDGLFNARPSPFCECNLFFSLHKIFAKIFLLLPVDRVCQCSEAVSKSKRLVSLMHGIAVQFMKIRRIFNSWRQSRQFMQIRRICNSFPCLILSIPFCNSHTQAFP